MQNWEDYLRDKGYTGRAATGDEVAFPCFFDCNEEPDSRKRKLYVNRSTGMYSCKVCVSEGGSTLLMRHFGEEPERHDATYVPGSRRMEILEDATTVGETMLGNNEDVLLYLLGPRRGLSPEMIVERRLGYAPKLWPLTEQLPSEKKYSAEELQKSGLLAKGERGTYEYYRDRVLIPYIENGRVVQVRGKDIFGRYYTPIGDNVFIYNVDALKGATEAIVVEGEFDCMMLANLLAGASDDRLRHMAVIGLAGTGAIPEDFTARLAHLKRVWIGTDPDEPGRRASLKLEEIIGEKAIVMKWPETLLEKAATDGLEAKDVDWTTWIGRYGCTTHDVADMVRVKTRLRSAADALRLFRNRPTNGMKLGVPMLDNIILPGLLPGQLVVLLAKTGVGKTLLLCNLAWNLRHKRVMFVTLEMTAEEIWVRLARIARFYQPFASDDTIADLYANLRICDENRLTEEDLERLIDEYTEDLGEGPEVIMVDYLGYYARGRKGGSTYEQTSDAAMQLKAEGKKHKAIVIVPSQVNRSATPGKPIDEDDARDSGVVEETADFMFGIWRSDDALDPDEFVTPNAKLHLSILKSRHGGKGKTFLLQMGLQSLVVIDDTLPEAARARRESDSVFRGQPYDRWLEEQRSRDQEISR